MQVAMKPETFERAVAAGAGVAVLIYMNHAPECAVTHPAPMGAVVGTLAVARAAVDVPGPQRGHANDVQSVFAAVFPAVAFHWLRNIERTRGKDAIDLCAVV